jgi:FMN phosphatase YigB (HAD superfamily)
MTYTEPMPLKMVVLDAYGVIYDERGIAEPLLHFARQEGCVLPEAEFWQHYHEAMLGRCSSSDVWKRIGLNITDEELFERISAFFSLMPGLLEFAVSMQKLDLRVACISNDAADFSQWHRRRYGLESLISPWIISGEVGVPKPEPAIFERLLYRADLRAEECLLVDDRTVMLDAARTLGFQTARFGDAKYDAGDVQRHQTAANFRELEDLLRSLLV